MSSRIKNFFIHFKDCQHESIMDIFALAQKYSAGSAEPAFIGKTAALLFFEASTRTRMSFETACARLGVYPLIMDAKSSSSLEKGESYEDTILNIQAMSPSALIIRTGDQLDLLQMQTKVSMPIINAGWGKVGHPTQALLDIFTLWQKNKDIQKLKLLIVGDIKHSRVAASHLELAQILKYEVAFCGPDEFLPKNLKTRVFSKLKEGLEWADAVMSLRVQNERHSTAYSMQDFSQHYGLNQTTQSWIRPDCFIMHPGPINHGVEMTQEVIQDPRSIIFEQVKNGVFVRQALLFQAITGGVQP